MEKKTIGILGGMGPLATADLFRKIIEMTEAASDQEHVHVLIDSNTNIPDRTAAILHGGADPVPELTASAKRLEAAGADLLIMPCNTAHFFYDRVQEAVGIPVVSMIEAASEKVRSFGRTEAVILCTDGTKDAGVYQKVFDEKGISCIYPDPETQSCVMQMIYEGVKAGVAGIRDEDIQKDPRAEKIRASVETVNRWIREAGDIPCLLACTELPIAKDIYGLLGNFIDPTACLAEAAIRKAGYRVK